MIYILTTKGECWDKLCRKLNIPKKDTIWVNRVERLKGHAIKNKDRMIFTCGFDNNQELCDEALRRTYVNIEYIACCNKTYPDGVS